MGFWKDVRELRAAIRAKVEAGRGRRALVEAMQESAIRDGTREAVVKPPADIPERMSAAQFKELLDSGQITVKGKK